MPTLYVRCPRCEALFPTPLAVTDLRTTGLLVSGLPLRCPACREEQSFFTKDLRVLSDPTPESRTGPGGTRARGAEPVPRFGWSVSWWSRLTARL